jgi:hypothetical protein
MRILLGGFAATALLATAAGAAPIAFAGGTYTQDFDTLIASGTDQAWSNGATLTGWHLFRQPAPGAAITSYSATDGATTTGSFYSFGTGTQTDRALGGIGSGGAYFANPASGAVAGWIAVEIQNITGNLIDSVTVTYDGEQWRDGGNTTPQTMTVEYGFGPSFVTVGTWNPASALNFTSPINSSTAGALNGNLAANRVAGINTTLNNLGWANGTTLWIRFTETNDFGNDHGLAVDNFSFSASVAPIPEPATVALLGLAVVGGLMLRRRVAA